MGSDSIPLWIGFWICVFLGSFFSATETAFSLVNRIRMKARADEGDKRAKRVNYVVNHFEEAITAMLVGNNVVKTASASIATLLAARLFANNANVDTSSLMFTLITTLATTIVVFFCGEIIPKSFATDRAQTFALASGGIMRLLMRVLAPITAIFGFISKASTKMFQTEEAPSFTEDELIDILDTAEEEGVVDEEQNDMLKSALEFDETRVRDVMTMLKDVESLDIRSTTDEVLAAIREMGHSRIPVYSGSPDHIVGTLRIRRFLIEHRKRPGVKLRSMLTAPYFVREDAKIDEVLDAMRENKNHIAIVIDDEDRAVGVATIEDFLEELVGEIFDEEDVVDNNFQSLGGNKYLVSTSMLIGNTYERMGLEEKAPRGVAVRPWLSVILENLGHLPAEDESFLYGDKEITAREFDGPTVTHVEIRVLDEEELATLAQNSCEEVDA